MPNAIFRRVQHALALASLLLVACAAESQDPTTTSTETTLGAPLPGGAKGKSGIIEPLEPQLAPESVSANGTVASNGTPSTPSRPMPYRGVNLSSADFGSALPGVYGSDYTFPTDAEVDYYMGKGMNLFRVGFLWERLQPAANGAFDTTYANRLYALADYATSKGAHVVLNPQNFARYYGNTIGSAQVPDALFANFWSRLSARFKTNSNVMFDLVNEPNTMPTEQWVAAANAAIAAIRATGSTNTIIVPGNAWTGGWTWDESWYGTSNAVAMLKIVDPKNNFLIEAHQYLDSGGGGTSGACVSTTIGAERLVNFVSWLRTNHLKGMIGEFAGGANATCNTAIHGMLTYMMANTDVLEGFSWWGGGPWWPSNYPFRLDPTAGKDAPQMALLTPFL